MGDKERDKREYAEREVDDVSEVERCRCRRREVGRNRLNGEDRLDAGRQSFLSERHVLE
jgi:hypothetical protein